MAKKRVHEIAKAQGLTSKELLAALNAAGIEAKAAQSSVEESDALAALKNSSDGAKSSGDGAATATKTKKAPAKAASQKAGSPKADSAKASATQGNAEAPAKPASGDGAAAKKGPGK